MSSLISVVAYPSTMIGRQSLQTVDGSKGGLNVDCDDITAYKRVIVPRGVNVQCFRR